MSDVATAWAWSHLADLGPTPAFVTLMLLANEADTEGTLKRRRSTLASKMETSTKTITRHTTKLVDSELLEVYEGTKTNGGQGANTYQLRLDRCVQADRSVPPSLQGEDQRGDTSVPPLVSPHSGDGKDASKEQFEMTLKGCTSLPEPPKLTVDRHPLTAEEWQIAERAMAAFNECNDSKLRLIGTRGGATDALTRIISRIREHPELTADDLERIVRNNFANPWWKEPKLQGVGPIFGPKPWSRAMTNTGERPTGKKRSYERNRKDLKDPGW